MLKIAAFLVILVLVDMYPVSAQDASQVELPIYYHKAELVQKNEYREKFDEEVTVTSFVPVLGGSTIKQQLQLGTDEQHHAWVSYVLEDIESHSFRDNSNGWISDDTFTGCRPYEIDSAGWWSSKSTGQQIAIIRASCLHKKINHRKDWYVHVLGLIELDEDGMLESVLTSHGGLDNDWQNDELSIVKIEFIANVDEDADLEVVLLLQGYAGAVYLVLDRNDDGTYSQTRIHHDSWD